MCGIAGIFLDPSRAPASGLDALTAMTDSLFHRGPDGSGYWRDAEAGIGLGHRRLAIVDLSDAGRQPMASAGGDMMVTFNGEIYNFAAIRAELEALGHRFRGHSDTEVMLAAFEQFGIEPSLKRFAGMFAIGLWDRRRRVLHLIRDRIGKKPLYVAPVNGALLFASEARALRAFPGFRPDVDPSAVSMLLKYGWIPDSSCIWNGVFKLPPGAWMTVSMDDLAAKDPARIRSLVRSWWSLEDAARAGQANLLPEDDAGLTDALDDLLKTTVGERMMADVPLGAFLSGGIDSTLVVAQMQALSSRPVRTFTIGFEDPGYDEAAHAKAIAGHLGTDHTTWRITAAEARAVIPDLPAIWDEPFADESQIPTFLVSRLARQHVTVALSGDGGDECFGGYRRHLMAARMSTVLGLPAPLRRAGGAAMRLLNSQARGPLPMPDRIRRLAGRDMEKLAGVVAACGDAALYEQLVSLTAHPAGLTKAAMPAMDAAFLPDLPARLMYQDMARYLPGDVLVKVDRASMAVSLEARAPLLDHRIIEFAWRLPARMKIRGAVTKWLPRQVLRRYVPDALFERPKAGFNVPVASWLAGPLRPWAEDLFATGRRARAGFIDHDLVEKMWRRHLTGEADHGNELWAVLMFEAWHAAIDDISGPVRLGAGENFQPKAA